MTTQCTVSAHAKLNLWLRVLAREESGYHSIETLFHLIDLCDGVTVTIGSRGERTLRCSVDVGSERDNLAYRAAELYCAATSWDTGFHIDIVKRIPVSGGLGGGSADAAATLKALNRLSPSPIPQTALMELGSRLGADIPFLVYGSPCALAWGRGDRLLGLPALPRMHVALVVPPFGISTAEAYRQTDTEGSRGGWQLEVADLKGWDRVALLAGNDLSRTRVAESHIGLGTAVAALRDAGAILADMTGSGSVLFGIFDTEPDAGALERATGWPVVLTHTMLNVEGVARLD